MIGNDTTRLRCRHHRPMCQVFLVVLVGVITILAWLLSASVVDARPVITRYFMQLTGLPGAKRTEE